MSIRTGKKGQNKPRAGHKHDETNGKRESISSNASTDLDVSFDKTANSVKELQLMFEHQLTLVKTEFQSKVDTLYNVVKLKDEAIRKLQAEIGELKQSFNYMSKEISKNHNLVNECTKTMEHKFEDTNT